MATESVSVIIYLFTVTYFKYKIILSLLFLLEKFHRIVF